MTQAWIHNINPFALHIFGNFGIRWYGLSYLLGFAVVYVLSMFLAKRGKSGLKPEMVLDFVTYAAIGTMVGARVGYCVFYAPDLLLDIHGQFPFWGLVEVQKGGMSSHGGMIGIAVACWMFARKSKVMTLHLVDLCALGGPIGIFFGRIANFINGELVGRVAPEGYRWAVKFPQDILFWPGSSENLGRLNNLSEVVPLVGVKSEDWTYWVSNIRLDILSRDKIEETLQLIVNLIQQGNEALRTALGPHLLARYPSQLFASLLEGLFVFIVLFFVWYKARKPGVIAGLFGVLYAIVRIFDEQYRLPDAHIGFQLFGLTRGQWISIGLLVIMIGLLFYWATRKTAAISGWGPIKSLKKIKSK